MQPVARAIRPGVRAEPAVRAGTDPATGGSTPMKMRRLITGLLAGTMAMAAFGGTASAGAPAGGTIFVAHGIPGVKVDVCVNGAEARSNFKYGNSFALEG